MALVIIVELEFFLLKKRLEIGKKVSLCKLFGCLWDFLLDYPSAFECFYFD